MLLSGIFKFKCSQQHRCVERTAEPNFGPDWHFKLKNLKTGWTFYIYKTQSELFLIRSRLKSWHNYVQYKELLWCVSEWSFQAVTKSFWPSQGCPGRTDQWRLANNSLIFFLFFSWSICVNWNAHLNAFMSNQVFSQHVVLRCSDEMGSVLV